MSISVDDLLLGGRVTYTVAVPADVLAPGADPSVGDASVGGGDLPAADTSSAPDTPMGNGDGGEATVTLRPLVLADVQRIQRAARDDQGLTSVLMVQQALVEPGVTMDQVNRMHCGLVEFLVAEVNRISGLRLGRDELDDVVRAPMARACFELARHFGWTPDECAALTVGQILTYLELLGSTAVVPVDATPMREGV